MKKDIKHISGKLHVCGKSTFIGDEADLPGMLHAVLFLSPVAHATIKELDISAAQSFAGVAHVITAADIPGENQIGHVIKDEPLFPTQTIMYVGQPLAMVLSEDISFARAAAKLIKLSYEELNPIFDIDIADEASQWYIPERKIECGNVDMAMAECDHVISGAIESSAQEHFYMETQRARAIPGEGKQITIQSATQSTMEVQEVAAHVLGLAAHNIIIEVPRLGGAFGGKERNATIYACLAALGTFVTKRPVQLLLERDVDMLISGKRHPFKTYYTLGFGSDGSIQALDAQILANGGAYADLSIAILERAMFHIDNAYHIPNARIRGRACRTNLPPNTAYRGFGAPQGIFVIESLLNQIAVKLQLDPLELRCRSAYKDGQKSPYGQVVQEPVTASLLQQLKEVSDYEYLRTEVQSFNMNNSQRRQGIGIVPVKFGISFTTALLNQGSALIWVYADGSISVSTGGIEMGQELSTKMAVIVSRVLGVPMSFIRVESANTQRVGNASPTAASSGSDINGNAVKIAAEKILKNLLPAARLLLETSSGANIEERDIVFEEGVVYHNANPDIRISFAELVRFAYTERIPLAAYGYYKTPNLWFDRALGQGNPFYYYVYGCALARVEIDLYTAEHKVLDTFIIHENGQSLCEDIDRGQIIGAFIQSYGWCTMEEVLHDESGCYKTINPSTYKIPGIRDLPAKFDVRLVPACSQYASVMGSKATGEPPFIYGLAVFFALQEAVQSTNPDIELSFPATPEAIMQALSENWSF